jgi:hypothetical protein
VRAGIDSMRMALLFVWMAVGLVVAIPAGALPNVAVVGGATPSKWLLAVGVQHTVLAPEQVSADALATTQILVLPVERVRTPVVAQAVINFVRRGGAVLAVYWGPVVREGSEGAQPGYALLEILGARPVGWRGTGAVTVRLEPNVDRGGSMAAETLLPRGMLVTLQPQAETQILARWTPGGTPLPERDVAAVRTGNVVFCGLDLFAPANDTPAVRQLFMGLFGMLAPNLAFDQARESAAAAMAAVIKLGSQVDVAEMRSPHVNFAPVRQLLEQARDAAAQAKARVSQERYREVGPAVEVAQTALQKAQQLLVKLAANTR